MRWSTIFLAGCAFRAPGETAREACDAFVDTLETRSAECSLVTNKEWVQARRDSCGKVIGGDADGVRQCIDEYNALSCAGFYKTLELPTIPCAAYIELQRLP